MAEPFKNMMSPKTVRTLARWLREADGNFDSVAFVAASLDGLDELELKARVQQIADALRKHLAPSYSAALEHVLAALPEPLSSSDDVSSGFICWPFCTFVETYGLDQAEISLSALRVLTSRASAEFAIRPYLDRFPEMTLKALHSWTADPDPHVRRLVSEGTRPRLPWGQRLQAFVADPEPVIALITKLRDDPEEYVRRSVANNLNDIAKDHPQLVVGLLTEWSRDLSAERQKLIRHALRTLLKRGDPAALALLGYDPPSLELIRFELGSTDIKLGGELPFEVEVVGRSTQTQRLMIDYAVHHQKKGGKLSPKVFKWTTRRLKPGQRLQLSRRHPMRVVTTRTYYPGEHKLELLINGVSFGERGFELAGVGLT